MSQTATHASDIIESLLHIKTGDSTAVPVHPETCASAVKNTGGKTTNQADENKAIWASITGDTSGLSQELKDQLEADGIDPEAASQPYVVQFAAPAGSTADAAKTAMLASAEFGKLATGGICVLFVATA